MKSPDSELICLRRTRSSDAFRQAYKLLSDGFAGYSPVTEALSILLATSPEKCLDVPVAQRLLFEEMQKLSSTSVHFIPLTEDKNADQLEIIHDIHVAQSEINKSKTESSLLFTALGAVAGSGLDKISDAMSVVANDKVGKGTAMFVASALGEIFIALQAHSDRFHIPSLHSKDIQAFIKSMAIAYHRLKPEMQHIVLSTINKLKTVNREQITIAAVLSTVIALGIVIAQVTGFAPAFFATGPINTTIIDYFELSERRKKIDKELEDYESCRSFIESFLRVRYPY